MNGSDFIFLKTALLLFSFWSGVIYGRAIEREHVKIILELWSNPVIFMRKILERYDLKMPEENQ